MINKMFFDPLSPHTIPSSEEGTMLSNRNEIKVLSGVTRRSFSTTAAAAHAAADDVQRAFSCMCVSVCGRPRVRSVSLLHRSDVVGRVSHRCIRTPRWARPAPDVHTMVLPIVWLGERKGECERLFRRCALYAVHGVYEYCLLMFAFWAAVGARECKIRRYLLFVRIKFICCRENSGEWMLYIRCAKQYSSLYTYPSEIMWNTKLMLLDAFVAGKVCNAWILRQTAATKNSLHIKHAFYICKYTGLVRSRCKTSTEDFSRQNQIFNQIKFYSIMTSYTVNKYKWNP